MTAVKRATRRKLLRPFVSLIVPPHLLARQAFYGPSLPATDRRVLPGHGTIFLASPFMTIGRGLPSSTADVKIKRSSRILSSHTTSSVTVRSKLPDRSKMSKLPVPVQSGFTVTVPENVSFVTVPFKLDVALPFVAFPAASRVIIPTDVLSPTPTMVPLLLN